MKSGKSDRLRKPSCEEFQELFRPAIEGTLPGAEQAVLDNHLKSCASCRDEFGVQRQVLAAMSDAFKGQSVSESFDLATNRKLLAAGAHSASVRSRLSEAAQTEDAILDVEGMENTGFLASLQSSVGGASWWGVSIVLHVLVILLAGLISMAVSLPAPEDAAIMVTELAPRPKIEEAELTKPKNENDSALHSKHETPPTDPTSKEVNDIVVPPEILAKAELGDHFETINPDRPDTQSAFGNPDSHMFHSVQGNDEPEGGGGTGGATLDDMIGVGGAGSPGTGGGWGGGNGTGIGVGTGSGRGSFGSRSGGGRKLMVKRHGGSQATENSVEAALRWLAYHQEPDGHWDTRKYSGQQNVDAGVTGLALLAFLGAGHTEKIGAYKDNVKRAVNWILTQQRDDGAIGANYKEYWHYGFAYHHAICGLALSEAAAMARIPATMAAAQKAVDYSTEIHQRGEGSEKKAWRYHSNKEAPDSPPEDASVSGWFVMQLKSAKIGGLKVNPMSFEGALRYYDSIEQKKEFNGYMGGRFPYTKGGGPQLNPTAIGILCNLFLGRKPAELAGGAEFLAGNLPKWDKNMGDGVNNKAFPMYYTYYGTLTMFQMGGDHWKKWNVAMKDMLIPTQRKDGDEAGSWDPMGGADDQMSGRVYMTAMGALCLEVYYRYNLLNQK